MNDNKQKVEETLGQAARRLLAELDARKKAVPAYSGTRIQQSPKECPSSLGEKCRESERKRGEALHDSRQSTAYPAGGVTGGGLGVVAKVDGRPIFRQSFQSRVNANDDGLPNREYVIRDRTRSMLMLVTLPDVEW